MKNQILQVTFWDKYFKNLMNYIGIICIWTSWVRELLSYSFIYSHTDRWLSLSITCISWALTMCQALFPMFSFNSSLSWGQNVDVLEQSLFGGIVTCFSTFPYFCFLGFQIINLSQVSLGTILLFPQVCHTFWSQWKTFIEHFLRISVDLFF